MRAALLAVLGGLCALIVLPAAASAATPKPTTGKTVVVSKSRGTVTVKPRGGSSFKLGKARKIPVGSTVDATNGVVEMTSTKNRSGTVRQRAVFFDGAFKVTQKKANAPITDLQLIGGDFSGCAAEKQRTGVFQSRASRRRLWGRGKGRFRTRGRNGSATVRGTTWLTEDECQGTMAMSKSGEVRAESSDLAYDLEPGQSVIFYCNTDGIPGVSDLYCLAVLSQPADNIYAFGFATTGTSDDHYQLCLQQPDGTTVCDEFPFAEPDADGIRAGGVGCVPAQQGLHYVGWGLREQLIPVPLFFDAAAAGGELFCVSEPPRPGIDDQAKLSGKLRQARAAARVGQ